MFLLFEKIKGSLTRLKSSISSILKTVTVELPSLDQLSVEIMLYELSEIRASQVLIIVRRVGAEELYRRPLFRIHIREILIHHRVPHVQCHCYLVFSGGIITRISVYSECLNWRAVIA